MPIPADLERQVLDLPASEREELTVKLIISLDDGPADPEYDKLWAEEIARRIEAYERGDEELIEWSEVIARARAAISKVKAR